MYYYVFTGEQLRKLLTEAKTLSPQAIIDSLDSEEYQSDADLMDAAPDLLDLCLKAEALLDSIICGNVERSEVEALYNELKAKTDELVK